MSKSLQDQFLKLGLVNKKQANTVKKKKHQQKKAKTQGPDAEETKKIVQEAQQKKKKRSKELNRLQNKERQEKESAARIRQLIEKYRLTIEQGDIPYKFTDNNKIKRIFLPKEVADKLGNGSLAIVRQAGEYQIVPSGIAGEIEKVNKNLVVLMHERKSEVADDNDPYADYKVPDDLMW